MPVLSVRDLLGLWVAVMTMNGWRKITCAERDDLYFTSGLDLVPIASRTDLGGEFGDPEMFTEWGDRATEKPLLRDYRWPPRYREEPSTLLPDTRPCEHYVPLVEG